MKQLPAVLLCLIIILSIGAFFRFGNAHLYHVHELFHYVIGGKYFKYLGYRRIYAATALALEEQNLISRKITIRDLDDKKSFLKYNSWRQLGMEAKLSMGAEIWTDFKQDIAFFNEIITKRHGDRRYSRTDWDTIFTDHGFNPSPVWLVYASPLLHLFPLNSIFPYLILPDIALIAASLLLILSITPQPYRLPLLALFWITLDIFWGSKLHIYNWTGGSYLRYSWFFLLSSGLTQFYRNKFVSSGVLMTLAGLERVFPLAFLGTAGLVLLINAYRDRANPVAIRDHPVIRFAFGSVITIPIILVILTVLYPLHNLTDFGGNMVSYNNLYAPNSLGYKKAISYSGDMESYKPWHLLGKKDLTETFSKKYRNSWAAVAENRYKGNHFGYLLKFPLMLALTIFGIYFMPAILGIIFSGTVIIFLGTLAPNYYFVFLALYGAFIIISYATGDKNNNALHLFYFISFIIASSITVNQSDIPVFTGSFVSLLMLFFLFIAPTAYLPGKTRKITGFSLGLLVTATIWLQNYRYADPSKIPVPGSGILFNASGAGFSRIMPQLPAITSSLIDLNGKRIIEQGIIIPEGSSIQFEFNTVSITANPLYLMIRSDFVYPVTLGISVNGHADVVNVSVPNLGGFFDYKAVKLPRKLFAPGKNSVKLHLTRGAAFAIYHVWLYQ